VRRKRVRTTAEIVGFVKYWEIVADNLSKAGFSWGYVSAIDSNRRTIWIVDAHRCFKSQPGDRRQVALGSARKRPSFRPAKALD
jgi:hypothetical protein